MQPFNDKPVITLDDIARYHSGQLSATEMHAIEKAALHDPFLADALEGYAYTQTPQADVAQLKQRLEQRIAQDRKKTVVLPFRLQTALKIAAMVIVVAGAALIISQQLRTPSTNLANTETVNAVKEAPVTADTLSPVVTEPINEVAATDAGSTTTVAKTKRPATARQSKATPPLTNPVPQMETTSQPMADATFTPALKDSVSRAIAQSKAVTPAIAARRPGIAVSNSPQPITYFQGRVVDVNNNPVPYASVINRQTNTGIQTDAQGNFTVKAADSIVQIEVNSVGYQSNQQFLTNNNNGNTVVLAPSINPLNEVVIARGNIKAERANTNPRVTLEEVEPAQGWRRFDDYILQNLKLPEEIGIKPNEGNVQVSFDVNKKGEAVNIKVEKSLCEKCDEEAVRLVKEGRWKKTKKNKPAKAKINF